VDPPAETALSEFLVYLRLGFRHIADPGAYDHMLFIAALTVAYPATAWRRLLWLVTAFTVGHSVTLALATLDVVRVPSALVELLIPVTIVATGLAAVWFGRGEDEVHGPPGAKWPQYTLAAAFGLVHGLGFSNFLRALLGAEEGILQPLLAFNVGLELGQLLIVAAVLLLGTVVPRLLRLTRREWVLLVSGGTVAVALTMIAERLRAPAA
jgi:hydrogenase/urease accessory protein HupE